MLEPKAHRSVEPSEENTADRVARPHADLPPAPERVSALEAAVSFASSMARFVASGFKTVDEPLHALRMSHCQACDYRHESQCSLCRCFIAKKAWLPHEDCPIGRWRS